jgi:hypothetical protein
MFGLRFNKESYNAELCSSLSSTCIKTDSEKRERERKREEVYDWLGVYNMPFSFPSYETSRQLVGLVTHCFRVKVRKEID